MAEINHSLCVSYMLYSSAPRIWCGRASGNPAHRSDNGLREDKYIITRNKVKIATNDSIDLIKSNDSDYAAKVRIYNMEDNVDAEAAQFQRKIADISVYRNMGLKTRTHHILYYVTIIEEALRYLDHFSGLYTIVARYDVAPFDRIEMGAALIGMVASKNLSRLQLYDEENIAIVYENINNNNTIHATYNQERRMLDNLFALILERAIWRKKDIVVCDLFREFGFIKLVERLIRIPPHILQNIKKHHSGLFKVKYQKYVRSLINMLNMYEEVSYDYCEAISWIEDIVNYFYPELKDEINNRESEDEEEEEDEENEEDEQEEEDGEKDASDTTPTSLSDILNLSQDEFDL